MSDLHPVSVAKFTYAFHCLDLDGDGTLASEDFLRLASRLTALRGWREDDPRAGRMRRDLLDYWEMVCMLSDHDGSGTVELSEWLVFHALMIDETREFGAPPPWADAMIEALLSAVDSDGDGCIDLAEYGQFLAAIGSEMAPEAAFHRLDLDGSGWLDLQELMTLMGEYLVSTSAEEPGNFLLTGGWPS